MIIKVTMTPDVVSSEPLVLGAAIKIALSGGLALDDAAAHRVSGLSKHLWSVHNYPIWQMVKHFEASEA